MTDKSDPMAGDQRWEARGNGNTNPDLERDREALFEQADGPGYDSRWDEAACEEQGHRPADPRDVITDPYAAAAAERGVELPDDGGRMRGRVVCQNRWTAGSAVLMEQRVIYADLVKEAHGLLEPVDRSLGGAPEYMRGVVELIVRAAGLSHEDHQVRVLGDVLAGRATLFADPDGPARMHASLPADIQRVGNEVLARWCSEDQEPDDPPHRREPADLDQSDYEADGERMRDEYECSGPNPRSWRSPIATRPEPSRSRLSPARALRAGSLELISGLWYLAAGQTPDPAEETFYPGNGFTERDVISEAGDVIGQVIQQPDEGGYSFEYVAVTLADNYATFADMESAVAYVEHN